MRPDTWLPTSIWTTALSVPVALTLELTSPRVILTVLKSFLGAALAVYIRQPPSATATTSTHTAARLVRSRFLNEIAIEVTSPFQDSAGYLSCFPECGR